MSDSDHHYRHSPHDHDDRYPHSHILAHYATSAHDDKENELYIMSGRSAPSDDDVASATVEILPQYRGFKAVYYNPVIQVFFLGFVCFMGPGLFNALNGLGGGGMLNPTTSANANSTLYATFAVAAFFAG